MRKGDVVNLQTALSLLVCFKPQEAVDLKCVRLMWQVLKWNTAARDFYKKIGAEELQEWLPCRFDSKGLERFLAATAGTDAATES